MRNIAEVTTAVANGDLTRKITVDVKGEVLELKNTINTMVDQLSTFADEVTRVAREAGTEGKLGGQADVKGVGGTWKDLTDNVNLMVSNLTTQVRGVAQVVTAVADGDLNRKFTIEAKGEVAALAETVNAMVDRLRVFSAEVTRVAREVGSEGKLGGAAEVEGVSGVWRGLTESVNGMADNLTQQVRNIAEVTTAVAQGDLTRKITVDAKGEILRLKNTINTMVDQLSSFADEVTRVAREVGTEGQLGGQAKVKGVAGTWKDLTDNVNFMATNLTTQVRGIAKVVTAVADGDLNQKFTIEARGEVASLADTINAMIDTLRLFADQVTGVAREVGTEGVLGGQADVPNVSGTWKALTDNVNSMANNLTTQVRNIAEVTTAVASGDLSRKITVQAKGEVAELADTINTMVDQLSSFADEVTRVAREVGVEGRLGGQAEVPGVSGVWRGLTDNVNLMVRNLTDQVRNTADVTTAVAKGDLSQKIDRRGGRRVPRAEGHDQHDGRPARDVRRRGDARRARGRLRGHARRLRAGRRRLRRVARPDGVGERHGRQPDEPGAQHRRGDDRGRERRPLAQDHRAGEGRGRRARRHDQHDGRAAERVRRRGDARRPRGRHRGPAGRPGEGRRRQRRLARPDREREHARRQPVEPGAQHRRRDDRGRERRPDAQDHGRRARRDPRAEEHDQHDGRPALVVRRRGDARRPRGRHRGQLGGQAEREGRVGHVEGPHRLGELHGEQPDDSGAEHRRRDDRGRERRPDAQDHRRGTGEVAELAEHDQHDGRPALVVRRRGDARRPRGRHRGHARRPGEREGRRAARGRT